MAPRTLLLRGSCSATVWLFPCEAFPSTYHVNGGFATGPPLLTNTTPSGSGPPSPLPASGFSTSGATPTSHDTSSSHDTGTEADMMATRRQTSWLPVAHDTGPHWFTRSTMPLPRLLPPHRGRTVTPQILTPSLRITGQGCGNRPLWRGTGRLRRG